MTAIILFMDAAIGAAQIGRIKMAIITVTYAIVENGKCDARTYTDRTIEIDDCDVVDVTNDPTSNLEVPADLPGYSIVGACE